MLVDVNKGHGMSRELHLHSCAHCDADYLSHYVKPPQGGGLCKRCIEKVYTETRQSLKLREAAKREFEEEDRLKDEERKRLKAERALARSQRKS